MNWIEIPTVRASADAAYAGKVEIASGIGSSKKQAEMAAALDAWTQLSALPPTP